MIAAILIAFLFAWLLPEWAKHTKVGGEVFLRCLMMVVVPLVMTSVMSGILGLGDVRKLGRPGGTAVLFYVTTTVLAVLTGVLMFNLIQPGCHCERIACRADGRGGGNQSAKERSGRYF